MNINKTQNNGKTTLTLSGRLDTTTSPALLETLINELEEAKNVELDFAAVAYVSSAGLRVLLLGEKTAKANGGRLTLLNVSEEILEVFEMTGFADMLKIE